MSFCFLLADDIHIHARNFGPLFRYAKTRNVPVTVHEELRGLKGRAGDYRDEPALEPYRRALRGLAPEALRHHTHAMGNTPIELYPLCRAEALCFSVATEAHWHDEPVDHDAERVFARLAERSPEVLVDNLAAAAFWVDEWRRFLAEHEAGFSHAFVFSGSFTYGRVLMELLRLTRTKVHVLESTFTGKEFYCEERYSPIANRSDIRHPTVRHAIALPTDPIEALRAEAKAVQRVFLSQNKNVQQPEGADLPVFAEPERPTLLLLGQVVNDFSILEQRSGWLSSVDFYRSLLARTLAETDYNVVFKGHPWEHKKTHVRRPFTRERLERFAAGLPPEHARRFAIREEDNLQALGRAADHVALLSSQGGIELAFYTGLRPATFGSPYYAGAGFTDDFSPAPGSGREGREGALERFVASVHERGHRRVLGLEDYEALVAFLTRFLQYHAITERPSGLAQLARRLEEGSAEIGAPPPPKAQGAALDDLTFGERTARKLRKLRRDPRAFFRDARLLRALRRP